MERNKVSTGVNSDITKDYLKGLKYNEIQKKYNVSRWDIQNALHKTGIKTNRLKPYPPRLPGSKKKIKPKKPYQDYLNEYYPFSKGDNNPIRIDDLDVMERMDKTNGVDSIVEKDPNLRYHIEVNEKGEVRYEKGD